MLIRPVTTLEECRNVAELEHSIWQYAETGNAIPPAVLFVSLKRGGVLLAAFDEPGQMVGYVYATPALKEGQPTLWSHSLGVAAGARGRGVGAALKAAQRQQALRMGLDLIEWTFDPLQASIAQLNFGTLGVVVEEYEQDLYGDSSSVLHRGAPTDRFIAGWHLSTPHVERRLEAAARAAAAPAHARRATPPLSVRDSAVTAAVVVNPARQAADWLEPGDPNLEAEAARVLVEIPANFTAMLTGAPGLAREWRLATRAVFTAYFASGYRAVDFFLSREHGRGQYLLARAAG